MAKASQHAGVGVGALPDDLLRDIFARVPDKANLLRFAGVCRRWLRLIAKPAFLRRAGFSPEDARRRSFPVGAFYQNSALYSSPERMGDVSLFPPELERLYHPTPPGGWPFEFFAPNHDGLYNYAKPLASRRGLLLLRILPTPLDWRKLHLLVCHPLIGGDRGTRLVPPPPLDFDPKLYGADLTGYAIIMDADRRTCSGDDQQQSAAFKVLFTAQHSDDDKLVYAHSYSSATDNWSAPIKCSVLSGLTMSGPRAGVVAPGGTAYWLYRDEAHFYALGVSADATEVSLIKLPIQVDHDTLRLQPPFPCIAGGKLSFAVLDRQNSGMLNLWSTRHDDHGGDGWTHSNLMSKEAARIKIFAFAESRGAILVSDGYRLFALDLENKKMEPVTCSWYAKKLCRRYSRDKYCDGYNSCVECTYNIRVLYEMDWPSYIIHLSATRLGGTMS